MKILNNIINFFFGKPKILNDDFFGKMIDADGYFECKAYFSPIDKKIELGIGGDQNGPSKEARLFFKQIEKDYKVLIKIITPVIQSKLNKWDKKITIRKFNQEFKPIYLFIPDCKNKNIEWIISFETIHDSHMITIEMNQYKPQSVTIDG